MHPLWTTVTTRQLAATQTPPLCPGESSHPQLPYTMIMSCTQRSNARIEGSLSSTITRPRFGARAIDRRPEHPQREVARR